jgi:hypothetical protein
MRMIYARCAEKNVAYKQKQLGYFEIGRRRGAIGAEFLWA